MKLHLHPEQIPFNSEYVEEEEYFSSSVNGQANIGVGKAFLIKLPFHSEKVEEEEYLFLYLNEAPHKS